MSTDHKIYKENDFAIIEMRKEIEELKRTVATLVEDFRDMERSQTWYCGNDGNDSEITSSSSE